MSDSDHFLVFLVDKLHDLGDTLNVVLQMGGILVSGTLVSPEAYWNGLEDTAQYEGTANTVLLASSIRAGLDAITAIERDELPDETPEEPLEERTRILYMRDALLVSGGHIIARAPWWTGKISAVDAWWLGSLPPPSVPA